MQNDFYWKRHQLLSYRRTCKCIIWTSLKYTGFSLIWAKEATRYWKYTWQLWRFPSFPNKVERSCSGAAPRWPSNRLTCLKRSRTAPDSLLAFTQSTFCLVCRSSDSLWLIERWKLLAGTDTLLYLGNSGPEVAASDPAPSAHTFVCLINTCVCLAPRSPDTCPQFLELLSAP